MDSDAMSSKAVKKTRDSGIELLRIITMLGVVTIHYNQAAFKVVEKLSPAYYFMCMTEGMFICAVDLFMLISGYYLCKSQVRKLNKPIELFVQLYVIRLVSMLAACLLRHHSVDVKSIATILIPNNYFLVLYTVVYLISPYFNRMMNGLGRKQLKIFMILIIAAFSVWVTGFDFIGELKGEYIKNISTIGKYDSGEGFTIVTFMLSFLVGAYIRITKADERYNRTGVLAACYIGCAIFLAVTGIINEKLGSIRLCSAWEYCNPFVILEAALLFLIFKNIRLQSRLINSLAQASFMCYLLHQNLFPLANIKRAAAGPLHIMIIHWLITIVVIYLICWAANIIYSIAARPVFSKLDDLMMRKGWVLRVNDEAEE